MIIFDYDACTGCELCWKVCPRGVWGFELAEKKAKIVSHEKCIDCTACEFQCPVRAIRIERAIVPKRPEIIKCSSD